MHIILSQLLQSHLIFNLTIADAAAEVLVLLDIGSVVANKTFLQNCLQASVGALAECSNDFRHVRDVLSQVLNGMGQ